MEATSVQLPNGGLTARCFPLKENKNVFISEFCSLMNLGMYIINKLFYG